MVAWRPLVDYQEHLGENILCGESIITPIHNFEASNLRWHRPRKEQGGLWGLLGDATTKFFEPSNQTATYT